ncbi:conserved Plasmodium protein, unknown function [Plasmodium sp. gorilla clade G2]|uniref:conserved Plasmodium protein, unknown function n=1 Tax=Plasmodium sp. gorilla clade G2 TaxID=880535 RepID=UPI000D20F300|nr:conserved Plasmodium protein, unknown function [Plasmodium sp. gorilla clade G2]SOV17032.1 conserved Plasmodium protein, unknown function [Plasmodium sp. gorilla clade G2]
MKLNVQEKNKILDNLKNRLFKIEKVIGDIKLYEINEDVNDPLIDKDDKKEVVEEHQNCYDEIKEYIENINIDNLYKKKDELIEIIKKHKHTNSIAIHVCTIKLILQQISKDFLNDIYNQYNEFYIYIHSNNILDVYNTFEYKRNIILSHIDFMKSYSYQIKEIMKLKDNINSYNMSETELYLERLNKIEIKNQLLFSKVSSINTSLEQLAYKYGLLMKIASLIILKNKTKSL